MDTHSHADMALAIDAAVLRDAELDFAKVRYAAVGAYRPELGATDHHLD